MRQVGVTSEGRAVVAGIWSVCETLGLPLEDVLGFVAARGAVPSWLHLRDEMARAGIPRERVLGRIREAGLDVYEPGWFRVVMERLEAS